jgi:hypothetical protein
MRRWFFRILVGLLALIVLIIVTVQIILWTPLPRRIAMEQIEKQLGLRISADSLSISWWGRTRLGNVALGLPLSDKNFLHLQSLTIHHNTLIGLAVGRAFAIDEIDIDQPHIDILQDPNGQWNLQQVALLLARAGGSNTAQQSSADTSVPKLPNLRLTNGTVNLSDNQHHTLTLQPVTVTGDDQGTLVWKYNATIADAIIAKGELAPGGNWQHRVTLQAKNLDPILKGWGITTTYGAAVQAAWAGQATGQGVAGTLSIQQASAMAIPTLGNVTLTGAVELESAAAGLTLRPAKLNLTSTYSLLPNIALQSGSILSDAAGIHAQSLKLSALGGLANVDASFDPQAQSVDLHATWSGLSLAKQTSKSGSLTASLRQPFAGQPVIKAELDSNGTVGDTADATATPNHWATQLTLTGQGSSWKNIDWVLTAPKLACNTSGKTIDLSNASAHVTQRLPRITLTDLSLPEDTGASRANSAAFTSSGAIDFASAKWNVDATGGFNASYDNAPVPITLTLHALGDDQKYQLKQLAIAMSDVTLSAEGSYDKNKPAQPVDLHVKLDQQPRVNPDAPIQGEVAGDFNIVGVLFTDQGHLRPYLTTTGKLLGSDLVVFGHPLDDISVSLTGITESPKLTADRLGPIRTHLTTTNFYVLQAPWQLDAEYPDHNGALNVSLQTHKLPLEEIARVTKQPSLRGQLTDAKWTARISSPSLDGIALDSEYHLLKPSMNGLTADTIDATATLHDGVLELNPLLARNDSGTITTTAHFDLKSPAKILSTDTTVDHWPIPISGSVAAQVSAHNHLDVDFKNKLAATGSLSISTDINLLNAQLAHADVSANIRKRVITLDQFTGKIGGGVIDGSATIDLDKPLQATGRITCRDVEGRQLATVIPALDGLAGRYSFAITLAPARDPRPLAPVRVDINMSAVDGHYRTVKIGNGHLLAMRTIAYLDLDRAVLDPDYCVLHIADGDIHFWARADNRGGRGLSTLASFDLHNLQLDELAHASPTLTKPMPGVINGSATFVRSGIYVDQLLASAHFDLTQTDLVNFGPLTALYNLMNAGGGISSKPTGSGSIDLTFEQNRLRVNSFRFFNRGIDARGLFLLGPLNYTDPNKTPLTGQVVGTARALKGTRVALLSDFDSIYSALAGQLTTVNVGGNLKGPTYKQATLSDIGSAMRSLLVGDVAKANRSE